MRCRGWVAALSVVCACADEASFERVGGTLRRLEGPAEAYRWSEMPPATPGRMEHYLAGQGGWYFVEKDAPEDGEVVFFPPRDFAAMLLTPEQLGRCDAFLEGAGSGCVVHSGCYTLILRKNGDLQVRFKPACAQTDDTDMGRMYPATAGTFDAVGGAQERAGGALESAEGEGP